MCVSFGIDCTVDALLTVAPLLSPVQEASISPNDITIEMHMQDGMEVCYFILEIKENNPSAVE